MGEVREGEYLVIDGKRFSRWASPDRCPVKWIEADDLNGGFLLALFGTVPLVGGIRLKAVDPLLAFIALVVAAACVSFIFASFRRDSGRGTWRIRRARKMSSPPVPRGLPEDAVPCIALVNTGSGVLPERPGWAWLDRGLLRYRDESMEFALRPNDVGDLEDLLDFGPAKVNLPDGMPSIFLTLSPAIEVGGQVVHWWPGMGHLSDLAEKWKASDSDAEPLYPPTEPAPARILAPWAFSAAFSGFLWGSVLLAMQLLVRNMVPSEAGRHLEVFQAVGPWVPLLGLGAIRISQSTHDLYWRKRRRRQVERLRRAG